jgi:hypothetical protein
VGRVLAYISATIISCPLKSSHAVDDTKVEWISNFSGTAAVSIIKYYCGQ